MYAIKVNGLDKIKYLVPCNFHFATGIVIPMRGCDVSCNLFMLTFLTNRKT